MIGEFRYPTNYNSVLFSFEAEGKINFILATTTIEAKKHLNERYGEVIPIPVKVIDLITKNGHQKTNNFLSSIGDKWVVKNGLVFFP